MSTPFPKNPPPTMSVYWQAEVTNTVTGKRVRKTRKYRARSFHVAYLQMIQRLILNTTITAQDIGDTSRSLSNSPGTVTNTASGFSFETEGIGCGTGSTAVDATDFYLVTAIVEGTGSGQLTYGNNTTTVGSVASSSSITSFDLVRPIANSSGGTITVEEICVVITQSISATFRGFMVLRDVTGSITVLDGETLTVTYTFKTTA